MQLSSLALMKYLRPDEEHGAAVAMDRKEAQNTVYDHILSKHPTYASHICIWKGEKRPAWDLSGVT